MTKEELAKRKEITNKANEIIEYKKYLKLCSDADICPNDGADLKLEDNYQEASWVHIYCPKCNFKERHHYNRDCDDY